jgi:hypothetical protein
LTAQIHDTLLLDGQEFNIVAQAGGPLPGPLDFGMHPRELHTACWRGFYCGYALDGDGFLLLDSMTVGVCPEGWKPVNGVEPSGDEDYQKDYSGIGLRTGFTGKLQAADGFMPERYVHMGFHPSDCFVRLLELSLQAGRVLAVEDLSRENDALRKAGREESRGDLMGWIRDRFSLDIDKKGVRRPRDD